MGWVLIMPAPTLVEEAPQEAWLRLYRFRARDDPKDCSSAWLNTIAASAGHHAGDPLTAGALSRWNRR